MNKVAIIDMGSNTIKLLVASGSAHTLIPQCEAVEECRISTGISNAKPFLTEDSMARGLVAVKNLIRLALETGTETVHIVATSAVRDASNGRDFAKTIHEITGFPVKILSGREEAETIAGGLRFDPELDRLGKYIHFDLGGGSLECNLIDSGRLEFATSMPLGAVRMTEAYVSNARAPFTQSEANRIHERVSEVFAQYQIPSTDPCIPMVFTGGSATITRALIHHRPIQSKDLGTSMLLLSELQDLIRQLAPLDFEQRLKFEYLPKNRADVVCAAIQVLISIMELQHKSKFQHSLFALRHGMAAKSLDLE